MYYVLYIVIRIIIDIIYSVMFWLSLSLKFVYLLFFYIFIAIVDVRLTAYELGDHHEIYKQCLQGTTSDLPEWMIESQWSEGGPRDGSGGYLTFSLASFLVLLLILSGDIELNPGPETVL